MPALDEKVRNCETRPIIGQLPVIGGGFQKVVCGLGPYDDLGMIVAPGYQFAKDRCIAQGIDITSKRGQFTEAGQNILADPYS